MDDMRIGAALRAVRIRRRWRQADVAARAGVSRSLVSLVERGHLANTSLATVRSIGGALEVRIDVTARWRGGELDRLLNRRHSALHESVARALRGADGWLFAPEVSFSVYGERGTIDILAFHPASGCLLVIELKTAIIDVNDLVATMDRRCRLAPGIARDRGWHATSVSAWVVVLASSTSKRRVSDHAAMLRSAFPDDGRRMRAWLRRPVGSVRCLSFWTNRHPQ
jgi:transcriptional regulator with XRE-family HTH domain